MQERKKKVLDGIDKEILRTLYERGDLVSREIAKCVGLTASAISPRLNNLKKKGLIKIVKISGIRNFERTFGNQIMIIKAPRSIYWGLDLENDKKKL